MRLILLLTALLAYVSAIAQVEDEFNCVHNVSTNYEDPTNDDLPTINPDNYLNGFNWVPIDPVTELYTNYDCTDMEFAGTTIDDMNNIMASNLSYYDYISEGPLPLNENGWELLLVNLGRYPDDVNPIADNTFYSLPYIVIYNRYTGVLRVFFQFGLDYTVGNGPNAVEVMVSFVDNNSMSGVLRLNEGKDQGLDVTSDVTKIRSHAKAPAQGKQWASTDFQLAYDPCTCFYPSQLRIDFFQTASSTISLYGRSITLTDEPLIDNTTLQANPTEFLSGYDYNSILKEANGGGLVMHKSLEKMIEDYKEKLEKYNDDLVAVGEHNEKVKKNLALLNMGLFAVRIIANPPAGIATLTDVELAEKAAEKSASDNLSLTNGEINAYYFNLAIQNGGGWFEVIEKYYKGILKANSAGKKILNQKALFEAVGKVFGEKGTTFINQNFVAKKPPKKPPIPTATFTEMKYEGEISDQLELGGPSFYTPGTYGSTGTGSPTITEVSEYPVYNEILGTFALLESPKFKIIETTTDYQTDRTVNTEVYNLGAPIEVDIYRYKNWTTDYQILLEKELSYTMNPALDMTDYDLDVSFNIIATPKKRAVTNPTPNDAIINVFFDADNCVNMLSDNYDFSNNFPIVTNTRGINYYNTPIYDHFTFEDELNLPVTNHVTDHASADKKTFEIDTDFIPIDALNPFRTSIGIHQQTASHGHNYITSYDLDEEKYDHTKDADGNYIWDLSDPDFELPRELTVGYHGYEYEFKIQVKVAITMNFETENDQGIPNSVTQLLTYEVPAENLTYTQFGAIPNFYYTSGNISQFEKDLIFGDQVMNVGSSYDYQFNGQQVEGCTLNGTTYTCQAWNDITILGDIEIAAPYNVLFYAGNEIYVIGETEVPIESVLEIKPVLDFSSPNPAATYDEVKDFCKGVDGNAPPYQASRSQGKTGWENGESENVPSLPEMTDDWDFLLFPNPTSSHCNVRLSDIGDKKVSIQCYDITMKNINLPVSPEGNGMYRLETSELSPGIYLIQVATNGGTKSKRLIIN